MSDSLAKGTAWNGAATAMKMFGSLFLLPFVLSRFSNEEVACWYLFTAGLGFSALLEFGFGPSITRFFGYSRARSTNASKLVNGLDSIPSPEALLRAFFPVYLVISLIAFLFGGVAGWIYFGSLEWTLKEALPPRTLWLFIAGTAALNIMSSALNGVMIGTGHLTRAAKCQMLVFGFSLTISLFAIIKFESLQCFVFGTFAGSFFNLIVHLIGNRDIIRSSFSVLTEPTDGWKIIAIIWPSSWRLGIVSVGAFAITQASTLLIGRYLDPQKIAGYGLALQLFSAISGFAGVIVRTAVPSISAAYASRNIDRVRKLVAIVSGASASIFLLCSFVLVVFGPIFLPMLKSSIVLPSRPLLVFFAFYLFLEFWHSAFAIFITARNQVPFMFPALVSGLCVVGGSWVLLTQTNMGILGPMISQAIVQLAFNNWYWPNLVMNSLSLSLEEIVKETVGYCAAELKRWFHVLRELVNGLE